VLGEQAIKHFALVFRIAADRQVGRDDGRHHGDVAIPLLQPYRERLADERLFEKENPPVAGEPGEQVLRALVDKVPSQMRETHEIVRHVQGTSIGA
jgi:hypothetical protein